MAATVTLPVFIRVGDGAEQQVGTITADSAPEMQLSQAELLRMIAAEIESLLDDRPAAEGRQG
jgi:hypothetical protein